MKGRGILVPTALAFVFGAAAIALGRAAEAARAPEARAAGGLPPLGIVNVLAVDLLWLRADGLFATNRWPEMTAAYEMAGRTEPRLAAAFEYRGFHLAYNLAGNAATPEDRDRWVLEGIQVLSDGLERNPASGDLRAWLGHALFERSRRWPSLTSKLKAKRGRDPWDEAADHLGAAVKAEPGFGRAVIWLTDVLETRGLGCGRPAAARADFRRAGEAIRRLKALLRDADTKALEDLAVHFDELERAAGK